MELVKHMKIVKRDGRTVEYNPDKIRIAIEKANHEVSEKERISLKDIDSIIDYIESLDKKRMLVEDIQDIIEEKLMEYGKYSLAKKYIIYRYNRSIIRQTNTTDASILSLIKNNSYGSGSYLVANKQRDIMAGEASRDLAYRLLLPKNVVEADKDNRIKFCNVDHFTEPIIESSKINIKDMFDRGTVINGIKIERPKSFQSACNILVEILASVAFSQTGPIYVDLKDLFEYYNLTYEKKYSMYKALLKSTLNNEQIRALSQTQSFIEVKSGLQTILYQTNTITLADGTVPQVYFLVDTSSIESEFEENIIYEFIKQKISGIENEEGEKIIPEFPGIIYSVNDDNEDLKRYDYITNEILDSNLSVTLMSSARYKNFLKELTRFNQGSIILNLAALAHLSITDSREFIDVLRENLGYCYEALLCRNHNLQGIYSDKSPIHWKHGAIARLDHMERIDSFLKKEHSYMNLSILGFEAAINILDDDSIKSSIVSEIQTTIEKWNKESTFEVILSNYYDVSVVHEIEKSDADVMKKYNIQSYFDSLEFMKKDYFKNGIIYFYTGENLDIQYDNLLKNNFIIIKGHQEI